MWYEDSLSNIQVRRGGADGIMKTKISVPGIPSPTKFGRFSKGSFAVGLLLLLVLIGELKAQDFGYYSVENGTITLNSYTGSGGAVVIPNTINGLRVTGIAEGTFAY